AGRGGPARRPRGARVRGHERPRPERAGEALGLEPPPRGDADVARALEAAGGVPLGLTVAHEQDARGFGGDRPNQRAAPWTRPAARAARSRPTVSVRPSSARTWKIGGEAVPPVTARRVSRASSTSLS